MPNMAKINEEVITKFKFKVNEPRIQIIYTHIKRANNLLKEYPLSGSFQKTVNMIGKISIPRNSININEYITSNIYQITHLYNHKKKKHLESVLY